MQTDHGASVTAVVVHYRGADDTLACVASLRRQQPAPRVVVVDNASPDGSLARLEQELATQQDVTLLRAERNGGFGAGCNLGIAHALAAHPESRHVLLLNPDAALSATALAELVAAAGRHPEAGVVGCRIERPGGGAWFENGRFPRWTLSRFHCAAPDAPEDSAEFVTGACMLIDAALLRDGLRFDEQFFLYGEDADLCRQVRARGRELWITRAAQAVHADGGSQRGRPVLDDMTADRLRWLTRAKVRLARKWLTPAQRAVFWAVALTAKPLLGALRSRSLRFLRPYLQGLFVGRGPRPDAAASSP